MNIKSELLKKELEQSIPNLNEKTLLEVTNLSLKKYDFLEKETDMIIEDLLSFKNLENLILYKFNITNESIKIIEKLENLKSITFDFCTISTDQLSLPSDVQSVYFNVCSNLNPEKLSAINADKIEIVGKYDKSEKIDICKFSTNDNVKTLNINNYQINNLKDIYKISPILTSINLDGSIVEENELKKISEKIAVSHNEKYLKFE